MTEPLARLRVSLYARFSSDNQRDTSIDDQVRLCREYVSRNGGEVENDSVVTDYAASGASAARAGFEGLLRLIETRAVDVVVTESADRLSRDLGDADRLWKLCEYHRVRLICVSDGIDSARDGSRMQFQFKAVMSDQYLVDLGKKTRRGLVGASQRGHSTGGLPFGYVSKAILSEGAREPTGYEILIDPSQAATVVRIYELYAESRSFRSIAAILTAANVPPPRVRSRHRLKGWVASTVRSILNNEAYVGRWTFLKKEWRNVPGTKVRRYRARPADEVLTHERPELRIVEETLWSAVRARRKTVSAKYKGASPITCPARRTSHPLSGLLKCALCGFPMIIAGGSPNRIYRCSGHRDRGVCTNNLHVRADILRDAVFGELQKILLDDAAVFYARKRWAERQGQASRKRTEEVRGAEGEIQTVEAQIRRLLDFIMSTDDGTSLGAVREALRERQLEKAALESRLMAAKVRDSAPIHLPTAAEVRTAVLDLESALSHDPIRARAILSRVFAGGVLLVEPGPDSKLVIRSEVLPLMLVAAKTSKPRAVRTEASPIVYSEGCAGRI
jgi:site-specific DNA recombinase